MTTLQQMINQVIGAYPDSPFWKTKVMRMKDTQIQALYFKFKKEGKIK